ncbi:MAG: membrane protein insertase YidC [Lachnospiraceae bacterium]|nr:membrane protein insertase YidC [Parasporobacterium sp.]MBR3396329.1 membrane protein insertase YidC [Lachnospiraceae bacterium]
MLILLSKVTTPVISWISQLLGWLMNGIYILLNNLGTERIGYSIIVYTLIVYMIMLPIQIRTQKQSKMQAYMQPEISKIQMKYRGRRDQESMTRMNDEMQTVYAKYGFSPYGTCLPLAFQMILLIGVYQVIYHIPGYIARIGNLFSPLAEKIMALPGGAEAMQTFISDNKIRVAIRETITQTNVIDALYLLKPSQWAALPQVSAFSSLSGEISQLSDRVKDVNYFMGMNISMSPWDIIKDSFSSHAWGFLLIGIAIPVVAWLTQWIGIKLQPQQPSNNAQDQMANTMRSMNLIMPIFSAFICATLSLGVAIYWIVGAVFRAIQMIIINRSMMKVDMEEMIKKNLEKAAKKKKKKPNAVNQKEAVEQSRVSQQAYTNSKKIRNYNNSASAKKSTKKGETGNEIWNYQSDDPNSMFSKANMVSKYNNTHGNTSGKKRKGK